MRLFKATYKDRHGKARESAKWYGEFKDHAQIVRRIPLLTDKSASAEAGRKIDRLVALKVAGDTPDSDLCRWFSDGPKHVILKLTEWSVVDSIRIGIAKTLAEHLADYERDISANGNSAKHASVSHARAKKIIEGCKFRCVADMNCDAVKAYLTKLRKEGQISARTFGYYVRDLRAFAKWLLRSRRARENPFEHLEGLGAKALANDATILRRAMTAQETCALLETTANQPVRYEMSGAERSLVYRLAVETGLRASEIASLTKASFRLNDKVPVVFVPGSATKNARDAELPLRPRTAELLREHLSTKLPPAKAFAIPPSTETARMIRADLAATGIPDTDTDGRKVDFHALRHTFLTLLASSGVHPKVAQDLARHSDINLTLSRYSHTLMEQRSEAVARLPNFDKGADQATGTDKK